MPIYEYKCDKCGVVEVMQRITENPLKKCPNCKGKAERIISHTSFVLKGSGWYATDYASKPKSDSSPDSASTNSTSSGEAASNGTSAPPKSAAEKPKPSAEKTASKSPD